MYTGFLNRIKDYFSLVKFTHTLFAMPFAITGFVLAVSVTGTILSLRLLLLILLALVSARNAAMGFNRYADRDIDARNPRTKNREIPSGVISAKSVMFFVIVNAIVFVVSTWFINRLSFMLSFPTLLVLLGYSYMKRVTPMSHYVLGVALSIAPTGAYIAVIGEFDFAPVILSLIVFFWVSGFDIIYSLADKDFDRKNSLYSIPRVLGVKNALRISSAGHVMVFPFMVLFFFAVNDMADLLGWSYIAGSFIFLVLLLWQHLIVSSKDLSRVNAAFFTANGFASVFFALFTIADLLF